jgi:acyl-CoA synthetase (AMP-forming)/AMP-acid ligase II
MPLYHSSAALLGFGNVMEAGGTVALGRKFSTKLFWDEVRASGATIVQYVGETCRYLLAAPSQVDPVTGENLDKKHNVRVAFGNGLRPDVWNKFKERFGIETIAEFYAATEGTLGTWNYSSNDFGRGAIGRNGSIYNTIMGLSVAVVELDVETEEPWRDPKTGLCKKVAAGEPGELLFKIDASNIERRFQGYYNNKKATMAKVMRDVLSKGDAWFRTGDMVRWDGEGRVFFNDRIGDTFRWKSENVSTQEVSEAVGRHASVAEANVYGVQLPHHDGRAGCAAVVFDEGSGGIASPDDRLLKSLAAHVRRELPRYALPLFLRVMPRVGMQMTGTNKQQKTSLQKEGVSLPEGAESAMYWLRDDTYVPFTKKDWDEMSGGRVKL